MANVKYLEIALTTFSKNQIKSNCDDGSMIISIVTVLNALKKYEIGIPKEYFESYGVYFGIASWLKDEEKNGNIVLVGGDNTYDMDGQVSVHFGFAQYDSLVLNKTFVLMHIHDGEPFLRETIWHNRYPAMLFCFEKGTSFYNILDDIMFEEADVPSMTIELNNKHYLVLPRIISESYFVKCLETGEELEAIDEVCFYGNYAKVRKQIISYLEMQRTLRLNKD